MKGPQGFATWINILMNLILGVLIVFAVFARISLGAGMPIFPPAAMIGVVISSFCVGFTAGTLVPAMDWGMKISGAVGAKPGTLANHIICSITLGACMGFCISCGNYLIADLGTLGFAGAIADIAANVLFIMACAIVLVIIFLKPVQAISAKLSGFDPTQMPH